MLTSGHSIACVIHAMSAISGLGATRFAAVPRLAVCRIHSLRGCRSLLHFRNSSCWSRRQRVSFLGPSFIANRTALMMSSSTGLTPRSSLDGKPFSMASSRCMSLSFVCRTRLDVCGVLSFPSESMAAPLPRFWAGGRLNSVMPTGSRPFLSMAAASKKACTCGIGMPSSISANSAGGGSSWG